MKTPTPKTDAAVFAYDRGDREAVIRLARDFELRIQEVKKIAEWQRDSGVALLTGAKIVKILTRPTSRKPSASHNKPKAANRRTKR